MQCPVLTGSVLSYLPDYAMSVTDVVYGAICRTVRCPALTERMVVQGTNEARAVSSNKRQVYAARIFMAINTCSTYAEQCKLHLSICKATSLEGLPMMVASKRCLH